ncbi:MAG: mannosyltransferase family protein [Acidimicrobiia bacterium]|nr:mannosyltransferase family protein [Acidimicrobiia bacterium]
MTVTTTEDVARSRGGRERTTGLDRRLLRIAVIAFLVLRAVSTLMGVAAAELGTPVEEIPENARELLGEDQLDSGVSRYLLDPWQRHDTVRYLRIAREGYSHSIDSVFAPLYPLLIRAVATPLGGDSAARMLAALIVSNTALIGLLYVFLRLVSSNFDDRTAIRSMIALLVFPTGFFLAAGYAEPLTLFALFASLLQLQKGRTLQAGMLGAVAALSRLTGWVASIPIAWSLWHRRHEVRAAGPATVAKEVAAAGLPIVASASFLAYRWLNGLPSITWVYENEWFSETSWPGHDFLLSFWWIVSGSVPEGTAFSFYIDFLAVCLALAAWRWSWNRMPRTWVMYTIAATLFMMLPVNHAVTHRSVSRYVLAVFPVFVMLASIRSARLRRTLAMVSGTLSLIFMFTFGSWYWVA